MDVFYKDRTILTPEIILDKEEDFFYISGKSVMENSEEFYKPVLNWFEKYFKNPQKISGIIFALEYFNSSSSIQIGKIIDLFVKNQNKTQVIIDWIYESGDELSEESGKEFENIYGYKFNIIEIDEKNSKIFLI